MTPPAPGYLGGMARRFDALDRYPHADEMLEKVPVVRGYFDHAGLWPKPEPLRHPVGIAAGVGDPTGAIG